MLYASRLIRLRSLVLLSFSVSAIFFYFLNDPATAKFNIPCILYTVTGWQCWGCGGQRAFHQLLHGDVSAAFHLNALIFPVLILITYVLFEELFRERPDYSWLRKRNIQLTAAILVFGFTILRNIL